MRNCPDCGDVTEKQHCEGSTSCGWWVCLSCKIVFDAARIERRMPWLGK